MKKILTLLTTLAGVLILLAPNAAHARQQVATFDARDDAPRPAARNAARTSAEESRARATALEKRKAALQKYLASVEPASADYEAASRSIREIEVKLRDIAAAAAAEAEAARPLPVRFARQMEGVSADDSPASKLLSISPGDRRSRFKSEVRIKVSPSFNSNIKITVVNNTGEEVYNNTLRYLVRGVDDYTTTVTLGEGVNIVKASSTDDKVVSNALLISGGELPADTAAKAERTVNAAPKAFRRQSQEGLVGLLLGGVVVSQQADRFSQADPFMGFIVGFSGQPNPNSSRALHFRVKGIFQVQPKKDEAPPKDIAAVDPSDFTPFLSSRKSFDIEMHGWWDTQLFRQTQRVRVGLYGAVGGTTYLSKNELLGDETVEVEQKDAEGNETGEETELDPELAKVDNDINLYYEGGLIGHFFGGEKKLFMQAILAYGNYEGLAGLNPPGDGFWGNSRNRFIGKLRVFPTFLDVSAEGDSNLYSPMFGVELNAGRGPDQLKFFTGVAVSISAFKKLGP